MISFSGIVLTHFYYDQLLFVTTANDEQIGAYIRNCVQQRILFLKKVKNSKVRIKINKTNEKKIVTRTENIPINLCLVTRTVCT